MNLDEAIKHTEEVADLCEYEASKYDMNDPYESYIACQEGECGEKHRQLAEWLQELKRLREQTKWIPVSERLPEEGERVIIQYGDGRFEVIDRVRFKIWNLPNSPYAKVVAWMSAPEPYKESEDKK